LHKRRGGGDFLASWAIISFSRMTLLHGISWLVGSTKCWLTHLTVIGLNFITGQSLPADNWQQYTGMFESWNTVILISCCLHFVNRISMSPDKLDRTARAWGLYISNPVSLTDDMLPFLYPFVKAPVTRRPRDLGFVLYVASCGIDLNLEIRNSATTSPLAGGGSVGGWEKLNTRDFTSVMGNIFCFHCCDGC
jgi:hypothetical protein